MWLKVQIQLEEEQLKALRQSSAETGKSTADLVREGIKLYLNSRTRPSRQDQVRRAIAAIGKFSGGTTDGSRNHDRYLAEFRK